MQTLNEEDIDFIIFYENPDLKLDRLVKTFSFYRPLKIFKNFQTIKNWLNSKYNFDSYIKNIYQILKEKFYILNII